MSSDRCDQVKGEASEHFASDLKTLQNSDSSLAEPDYLFQCIFNHAWNGMVLANVEQQSFVKANPAFLRMTGYEAEELPDLHVARIHPAESLPEVMEAFRRMACGEISLAENIPVLRRDGSMFFANINGSPFALNDTRYVLGEFRDLTDQRLAQQALAAEEITRRRLFESMRDAFAVVDMSGRIVDCNPAYCSMLGYSLAELKEKTYPELTPERWHAAEAQTIAEQVLLLGVSDIYRKEFIRKDGTVFPVELKVVLLRDDTGQPEGMWGVVRDITERKQTEADLIQARTQAEAANRAKSRFLAAASHDLRQPLMAISLFVDTLSRVSTSQQQKKLTDQMKSSVQSLGGLLDKLLNIARLDSGAIEAKLCDVRSSQLIQWIEMEFRPLFQARSLHLKCRLPRQEITFHTDLNLLKSLLGNLFDNALKYCERGGVLFAIRNRTNRALIQLWDTGIGIPPEHIDLIFEEYYQVGNAARSREQGVGLGLSIVSRQARLIEAEIGCRSRVGRGSVFEISLPIGAAPAEAGVECGDLEDDLNLSPFVGRKIVVIEDDRRLAEAMADALGYLGLQVSVFEHAESALHNSGIADADYYITDLQLPGAMNGFDLLMAIEQRACVPIRAVVLTGGSTEGQWGNWESSKWPVFVKPTPLSTLLGALIPAVSL